jgi:hypothetical protein
MADAMNLPSAQTHLSAMTDPKMLRLFIEIAARTKSRDVDDWWAVKGHVRYGEEFRLARREAGKVNIERGRARTQMIRGRDR